MQGVGGKVGASTVRQATSVLPVDAILSRLRTEFRPQRADLIWGSSAGGKRYFWTRTFDPQFGTFSQLERSPRALSVLFVAGFHQNGNSALHFSGRQDIPKITLNLVILPGSSEQPEL